MRNPKPTAQRAVLLRAIERAEKRVEEMTDREHAAEMRIQLAAYRAGMDQEVTHLLARDIAAIEAESKPAPAKCTAQVTIENGVVSTSSCITKVPLIDTGESSDGSRDYYRCPDCGKNITIDYTEN